MAEKPRYSRTTDIFDLAVFMASKSAGVTLNDICERYNVSRRTAERMRDSLIYGLSTIDEIETDDTQKHWGFTNYFIANLITFSTKEIANLEQLQRRTTNKELKLELGKTVEKMKAFMHKNLNSVEKNIELIMQTEGYAVRQMPQYKISVRTLEVIRDAFRYSKVVTGIYHGKNRVIEPLGMVYGAKIYLAAREKAKGDGIYTYLLHKFEDLKLIDEVFDKGDFNLQEYTNRSFGVYQGEILDVELVFTQNAADDASKYNFHPTQTGKFNDDGTYSVKFKAGGDREIMWHVFKWGASCKIVKPETLRNEYKRYLEEVLQSR